MKSAKKYSFYDNKGNHLIDATIEYDDSNFNWSQSNYWKMLNDLKAAGYPTSNYNASKLDAQI